MLMMLATLNSTLPVESEERVGETHSPVLVDEMIFGVAGKEWAEESAMEQKAHLVEVVHETMEEVGRAMELQEAQSELQLLVQGYEHCLLPRASHAKDEIPHQHYL